MNPPALSRHYTQSELEHMDIDELDRLAFGVAGGDQLELDPSQIRIKYPDDLINPQHRLKTEGMAWARSVDLSEPVDISVNEAGEFELEDGHHRWTAAGLTGRKLQAIIEIKGNPVRRILTRQAEQASLAKSRPPTPPARARRPTA